MSLSKYFKSSDFFQPEDIFKKKQQVNSGWKSSIKDVPSVPFQAEKRIEEEKSDHLTSSYSPDTVKRQTGETVLASPEHINENEGEPTPSRDAPDLSEFIKISEAEAKIEAAFESGVQSGVEKAEKDYGSATSALMSICQQLDTVRETIIANSSNEMQEFALAVAERIIRSYIMDNDNTIVATIDEALQRSVKSEEFYIYINPDDYDIVLEKSDELIAGLSGLNNIVIKKDITIEKGGAKIESDNCTIDATIASQFDLIRAEVKKRL